MHTHIHTCIHTDTHAHSGSHTIIRPANTYRPAHIQADDHTYSEAYTQAYIPHTTIHSVMHAYRQPDIHTNRHTCIHKTDWQGIIPTSIHIYKITGSPTG